MPSKYNVLIFYNNVTASDSERYQRLNAYNLFNLHIATNLISALRILKNSDINFAIIDMNIHSLNIKNFILNIRKYNFNPIIILANPISRTIANELSLFAKSSGFSVMITVLQSIDDKELQKLIQHLKNSTQPFKLPLSDDNELQTFFDKTVIQQALQKGNITAWFQPKVALTNGKIIGAEALARWDHPTYGFMLAGSLLNAIRYYKLQKDFLIHILNDALNAHLIWQRSGHTIPISINLPTCLLDDPELPEELYQRIKIWGVNPKNVTFELLEDEEIYNIVDYHQGVSRLRLKHFGVAQDVFCKGYSSMKQFITTPFTELKIDKSLIISAADDPIRQAAVAALVHLGQQLDLMITAEGIENIRDLQFLRHIGCDSGQGFLISPAIRSTHFRVLLDNGVKDIPSSKPVI